MSEPGVISVAHSPDSDDHFLFWAILHNAIDCEGLQFDFTQLDTEALNRAAITEAYDVTAISVAVYPQIAHSYSILESGASVGRGFGPVLAAPKAISREKLATCRIAIPGDTTTAALVLRRICPDAQTTVFPIVPFDAVFAALRSGEVDAVLLIHEGQCSYAEHGLQKIVDVGQWWYEQTDLPLPLGVNVINRNLGEEQVTKVARVLQRAIRYALDHTDELIDDLVAINTKRGADVQSKEGIKKYLAMYANEDSYQLDAACKEAIARLLASEVRYA